MRLFISGLAGIALVLALVPLDPAAAGKADNTFRASIERPIDVIDPYYSGINEGLSIVGQLFWDTLIYRDPRTNQYVPLLAKSWTWKDDLTLELDLRTDVKWHYGVPFNADDVVYTVNYVLSRTRITRFSTQSGLSGWLARRSSEFTRLPSS